MAKRKPGRVTPGKAKKKLADEFNLDEQKAEFISEAMERRKAFTYFGREWLLVPYLKATSDNLDAMTIDANGEIIIVPPTDDAGESKIKDWMQAAFRQVIDPDDFDDFVIAVWGDDDDDEENGDEDMPQEMLMNLIEWCGAQVSGEPEDPS